MEVDAIKLRTEESKGNESRSTAANQFVERCESQSECNSTWSAKSDWEDIELNGETDHGDMEDRETGFDDGSASVRNRRESGPPMNTKST